jgi:hypothetical protein
MPYDCFRFITVCGIVSSSYICITFNFVSPWSDVKFSYYRALSVHNPYISNPLIRSPSSVSLSLSVVSLSFRFIYFVSIYFSHESLFISRFTSLTCRLNLLLNIVVLKLVNLARCTVCCIKSCAGFLYRVSAKMYEGKNINWALEVSYNMSFHFLRS